MTVSNIFFFFQSEDNNSVVSNLKEVTFEFVADLFVKTIRVTYLRKDLILSFDNSCMFVNTSSNSVLEQ